MQDHTVFARMHIHDHEDVVFCNDNKTGLRAIIAVHNTTLGPSLGGTRMWTYARETDALIDVLRLSRGMTYKAAVAGLKLGGGKAVIMGDSKTMKSEALFRRFGQFVDSLGGKYITAEDVGVGPSDMVWVSKETKHVTGLPGKSGDPSPVTAFGVYMGMKASAKRKWGSDALKGKKILVQGVGHVGASLVKHLCEEGAVVMVTDIFEDRLKTLAAELPVKIVDKDNFFVLLFDIYAPCDLVATFNNDSIARMKCEVVCGAANNQLEDEKVHGAKLVEKGIVYAPDFVVNAGGLINVYSEITGDSREKVMESAGNIYQTTLRIFERAEKENIPTYLAANLLAEERLRKGV